MPTNEQRALWAAIRADPLDDTPRLVYADWLDEHGDPDRAEFIRVQIELARLPQDGRKCRKQRAEMKDRRDRLFRKNRGRWQRPYRTLLKASGRPVTPTGRFVPPQMPFTRGFYGPVDVTVEGIRRLISHVEELEPVNSLRVLDAGHDLPRQGAEALANWSGAGSVTALVVCGCGDNTIATIVSTGHLRNLSWLSLTLGTISDRGAGLLAGWSAATNLQSLDLSFNVIGDEGVNALIDSPYLEHLKSLYLENTDINKSTMRRLRDRFGRWLLV